MSPSASKDTAPATSDEGAALALVLVIVMVFSIFVATLFGVLGSSTASVGSLNQQARDRTAAESDLDLTVAALRSGAMPSSACGPNSILATTPIAGAGNAFTSVSCESVVAGQDPRYAVLATGTGATGGVDSSGGATVDGTLWSNSGVTVSGSQLSVRGDALALGACTGPLAEVKGAGASATTASATCDAANYLGAERTPTVLERQAPSSAGVVPACPSDPAQTLVTLSPGVYTDATALNTLFAACSTRDFWFKPGVYKFAFTNTTSSATACGPAAGNEHRLCLGGQVLGGTPAGWDPAAPATKTATGVWSTISSTGTWTNLDKGRLLDGANATTNVTNVPTTVTSSPSKATSTSKTRFANPANGTKRDGSNATLSFPATGSTSTAFEATSSSSTTFANPANALSVGTTATVPTSDVALSAARTSASWAGTGFQAVEGGTIVQAWLKVRFSVGSASDLRDVNVSIRRTDGYQCSTADALNSATRDASGFYVARIGIGATCVGTMEHFANATATLNVVRAAGAPTFRLDGVVFDAIITAPETASLDLSEVTPKQALGSSAPSQVVFAATHSEPARSNPRLVVGTCTFPLTTSSTTHTDNVDVTSCVDSNAELDALAVSFLVDRPDANAATASFDGLDVVATRPGANSNFSVSFTGSSLVLPDPVREVTSAKLVVMGSVTSYADVKLVVRPGDGSTCAPVVVTSTTLPDLTSCLSSAAKVNGATASFEFVANAPGSVTLDGVRLDVTYRPVLDRAPALGTGCARTSPGVQLAFSGDSRLSLGAGATTLCAGSEVISGSPSGSGAAILANAGSGCVELSTCPVLDVAAGRGQLSVAGAIHVPAGTARLGDVDVRAPLVDQGLVARRAELSAYGLRPGFTGKWISNATQTDGAGEEVVLVASVTRASKTRAVLRERVKFGVELQGRPATTLAWNPL